MRAAIVVVGSLNLDLVVRCPALPRPGQTVAAGDLARVPGGKGANQAAAAARLGGTVRMVGRVGDDPFAAALTDALRTDGVDVSAVRVTPDVATGTAVILVDDATGENAIVVSPGANGQLSPDDLPDTGGAVVVLLQLEVPLATVTAAARRAQGGRGATVVLDPAPTIGPLPAELLAAVDLITPNQTEAEALTGVAVRTPANAARAAGVLHAAGVDRVIVKLGGDGCLLSDHGRLLHVPGLAVDVVDTTAAGDCFNGALAVALAEDRPMADAARFANAAAALACTRAGAQSSLPTRAEVERLLAHG